jgi:hypothetical protein
MRKTIIFAGSFTDKDIILDEDRTGFRGWSYAWIVLCRSV